MPIGSFTTVPHVALHLTTRRPRRVLDLGMGTGFLGAVVRQWLDLGARPWGTFLAGVEAWAGYRNPLWELYDVVVVDTIDRYFAIAADRFDCVVLGDVLEHFDPAGGAELIRRARERVAPGGSLLVATPAVFFEQGAVHGNEHERHRSFWPADRLESLGFETILSGQEPQVALIPTVLARWDNPA